MKIMSVSGGIRMWETQRNLSIENIYLQNSEIEELIKWIVEREELREGKKCSECGRPLDSRGKCHECLNNQFLDNEYDAAYGKGGEPE